MDQHIACYYIGIFIVFASHAWMLYKPSPQVFTMEQHCYINIGATALIAYFFMWSQKYISF
jgi:hypothetical protein